jgi:probable addiction module antidote protein
MPIKTKSYKDWLGAKLSDPGRAARYLNTAREDSPAMFFKALRKVANSQSRPMTELAETVGVSRESLYRMMSETGNPSHENVSGILGAMGFKIEIVPIHAEENSGGARSVTYAPPKAKLTMPRLKGLSFGASPYGIAERIVAYWSDTSRPSGNETNFMTHIPATAGNVAYDIGGVISGNTAPARELPDTKFVLAQQAAQSRFEQMREHFNHG